MSVSTEPFIPWAKDITVLSMSKAWVHLWDGEYLKAYINWRGSIDLEFETEAIIERFMSRDLELEEEVVLAHERIKDPKQLMAWLKHWVQPPPHFTIKDGVRHQIWETGNKPPRKKGIHGIDHTNTWDRSYYKGSDFLYAHFVIPDGPEGAVIFWNVPDQLVGEPTVWIGDFSDLMAFQSVEEINVDSDLWREYNWHFQNGFMWALQQMGSFEEPELLSSVALTAIMEDPEMLLEESVRAILKKGVEKYPEEIRLAVRDWMDLTGKRP